MLSDRSSRKKIILVANIIAFFVLVIQYTTLNPHGLIMSQILLGLSSAFREIAWSPCVTDISTDRDQAHLFVVGSGVSLLGVFAGNIIVGMMPQVFASVSGLSATDPLVIPYRYTLWLSFIPSAIAILLISKISTDTPSCATATLGLKNVRNWGFIGKYTPAVASVGLGAGMIVMFFNLFFTHEFPIDSGLLGLFSESTLSYSRLGTS